MSQKEKEELDPEMLANIDLLLNLDAIEAEADWNTVADLEAAESSNDSESEGKAKPNSDEVQ